MDCLDVYLEVVNQLLGDLAYRRRLLYEPVLVNLRKRLLELLSKLLERSKEPHSHLVVTLQYLAIELEAVNLRHADVEYCDLVCIRSECLERFCGVLERVNR